MPLEKNVGHELVGHELENVGHELCDVGHKLDSN